MKTYFTLLFFIFCLSSKSQTIVKFPLDSTGKISYTEVVKIDSTSEEILYSRAKIWITNIFNSAKDVIQLDSKEDGIIICKGSLKAHGLNRGGRDMSVGYVHFTMKLSFKDNKYKYEFTDFIHDGIDQFYGGNLEDLEPKGYMSGMGYHKMIWDGVRQNTDIDIKQMIKQLNNGMTTNANKSDW